MSDKDPLKEERFTRIRRVKRLLRYLPRRATLHRYPFIKFFAETARKRPFLWSFRVPEVIPAIYAGSILTLAPLYGVQIPIAFALALILRANLPILVALQFVSNFITVPPIYFLDYQVGHFFMAIFGSETPPVDPTQLQYTLTKTSQAFNKGRKIFEETLLGGIILGYFLGFFLSITYRFIANRYKKNYTIINNPLSQKPHVKKHPTSSEHSK